MPLLYSAFLAIYTLIIHLAAPFRLKAQQWTAGRKQLLRHIAASLRPEERRIWIHCASLGEFEQARPLIEAIKSNYPSFKIVLTFFSPSGYENKKDYTGVDYVFYLPMDGRQNACRFIATVAPEKAIFVKYEFWYYYLRTLKAQQIPVYLVAGAFRKSQPFFKWYGSFFRDILGCFHQLMVQDMQSAVWLAKAGFRDNVSVSGDSRYDRVSSIAQQAPTFPLITQFCGDAPVLIAGSTWPEDEQVLKDSIIFLPDNWKIIIAPHETDAGTLTRTGKRMGTNHIFYSEYLRQLPDPAPRILIIDNVGMLASIYRYGHIAYVGGGFQKGGIHNTLEPAVFGLPVLFGPVYEKFTEARQLVEQGYAFPVQDAAQCGQVLQQLIRRQPEIALSTADALRKYIQAQTGATDRMLRLIFEVDAKQEK